MIHFYFIYCINHIIFNFMFIFPYYNRSPTSNSHNPTLIFNQIRIAVIVITYFNFPCKNWRCSHYQQQQGQKNFLFDHGVTHSRMFLDLSRCQCSVQFSATETDTESLAG